MPSMQHLVYRRFCRSLAGAHILHGRKNMQQQTAFCNYFRRMLNEF